MTDNRHPSYDVFISYSRNDRRVAIRLRRLIESFRLPKDLASNRTPLKVWRDLENIAGNELDKAIADATANSRKLLVICSEAAKRSREVEKEIRSFEKHRGARNIELAIVSGRPNEEVNESDAEQDQAFPEILLALLKRPLASDLRRNPRLSWLENFRHRREAELQVLAGLLDLPKAQVIDRAWVQFRRRAIAAGCGLLAAAILLVVYVLDRRVETSISSKAAESMSAGVSADALRLALDASRTSRIIRNGMHPQVVTALKAAIFAGGGYRLSSVRDDDADAVTQHAFGASGTIYGAGVALTRSNEGKYADIFRLWRWDLTTFGRELIYESDVPSSAPPFFSLVATATDPETVAVLPAGRSGILYFDPQALRRQHAPASSPSPGFFRDSRYYRGSWPVLRFLRPPEVVLDGRTVWNFSLIVPPATTLPNEEFRTVTSDGRVLVTCERGVLSVSVLGRDGASYVPGTPVMDGAKLPQAIACSSQRDTKFPDGGGFVSVREKVSSDGKWLLGFLSSRTSSDHFLSRIDEQSTRMLSLKWEVDPRNGQERFESGFSADGRWLVVGEGIDSSAALWDLAQSSDPQERLAALLSGSGLRDLKGLPVHAYASTPKGERLAIWIADRILILDTGGKGEPALLRTLALKFPADYPGDPFGSRLKLSSDGRWLLEHREGYDPKLFDLASETDVPSEIAVRKKDNYLSVDTVQFTPDARWLIAIARERRGSDNLEIRTFPLDESRFALVARRMLEAAK